MNEQPLPLQAVDRKRSGLRPVEPKTLVDRAVEAIIEGAAQGRIQPGDRLVETDLVQALNISRVPIREALRALESQGIVRNTPYRGMRLMEVTPKRLLDVLKARCALEQLAARDVAALAKKDSTMLDALEAPIAQMRSDLLRGDFYRYASADTEFHRTLCRLSGNDVLLQLWESLSRQLTILFGINSRQKNPKILLEEHVRLVQTLRNSTPEQLNMEIEDHIITQNLETEQIEALEGSPSTGS